MTYTLLSLRRFVDLPIGKKENKMAVTGYMFFDYDFGPNIYNVGIMNIGSVDPNLQEQSYCRTWKCTTYNWF
jgi:hypothetical protein